MRSFTRFNNDYILPEYQGMLDKYMTASVNEDILFSIPGVRREYHAASFQKMHARFGSIEDYFAEGQGITPAGQQALPEQFLAADPV